MVFSSLIDSSFNSLTVYKNSQLSAVNDYSYSSSVTVMLVCCSEIQVSVLSFIISIIHLHCCQVHVAIYIRSYLLK